MSKIISIANQKGGVGKTTTATAIASGLNLLGYKTLLVDTDPQGNATDTYQATQENTSTIYDVFTGAATAAESIQATAQGDIIAGDLNMSAADMQFAMQGREYILKKALHPIQKKYDYIIIDTPPALGVITINAFTAAHALIVPMFADRYSLKGISQLSDTINTVKEYSNPALVVDGILLTRYNDRTVLGRDIKEIIGEMAKILKTKVFSTTIRQSVSLQESQTQQESIFTYAPNSTTGVDYKTFISEYLGGARNG